MKSTISFGFYFFLVFSRKITTDKTQKEKEIFFKFFKLKFLSKK